LLGDNFVILRKNILGQEGFFMMLVIIMVFMAMAMNLKILVVRMN
jgi:hypothetical protein